MVQGTASQLICITSRGVDIWNKWRKSYLIRMNIQRTYLREDGFYHICAMELAIMEMVY